jgi:large subunit ribosomal protein L9
MEIILTEDVKNLGLEGEIHNVADGYARNFLFPEQKAVQANDRNKEQYKRAQEEIQERREKMIEEAESLAENLNETSLTLEKPASEEGSLYGSVNQEDILEALHEEGFENLSKETVVINEAIREIGDYTVTINLAGSVQAEVEVEIAPS